MGNHFLHEHPAGARSWKEPQMMNLLQHPKVQSTVSHQCEYGLMSPDKHGVLQLVKKPTRWMSSSGAMVRRLSRRCSGNHVHRVLEGGRAAAAAFYPVELMLEILRGMRDEADKVEQVVAVWEPIQQAISTMKLPEVTPCSNEQEVEPTSHSDRSKWAWLDKHEQEIRRSCTLPVGDYAPEWDQLGKDIA